MWPSEKQRREWARPWARCASSQQRSERPRGAACGPLRAPAPPVSAPLKARAPNTSSCVSKGSDAGGVALPPCPDPRKHFSRRNMAPGGGCGGRPLPAVVDRLTAVDGGATPSNTPPPPTAPRSGTGRGLRVRG